MCDSARLSLFHLRTPRRTIPISQLEAEQSLLNGGIPSGAYKDCRIPHLHSHYDRQAALAPMAANWTRDETDLLLRAWGDAKRASDDPNGSLPSGIFESFVDLCGNTSKRSEPAVRKQIATLRFNFNFIQQFDEAQRERGKRRSQTWFVTSPRKREEAFRNKVGVKFTYIPLDYRMFAALEALDDQPCDGSTERSPSRVADSAAHGPLAGDVWTIPELVTLVQAWREIIDDAQCTLKSLPHDLNQQIYDRFVELWGGATQRTVKAMCDKKLIFAFTHKKITRLLNHPTQKYRKWFSFSKDRRIEIVKSQIGPSNKIQVTAFDEDLYEELGDILAIEAALRGGCDDARSESSDSDDDEVAFPPVESGRNQRHHQVSTPSASSKAVHRVLDLPTEHESHDTLYRGPGRQTRGHAKESAAVRGERKANPIEARVRAATTKHQCEVASELRMIARALEDQVERIQRILHKLSRDRPSNDGVGRGQNHIEGCRRRKNDGNVGNERPSARCHNDDDDDEERHPRKRRRLRRRIS